MRTKMAMAKNLHAGDYLAEPSDMQLHIDNPRYKTKGKTVGKHICEVHVDRKEVRVVLSERLGFGHRRFKRTKFVKVVR